MAWICVAGAGSRAPTTRRVPRLPYRLLGPLVVSVNSVLIISISLFAGVAYKSIFVGGIPGLGRYAAIGLLVLTNLSAILAAARGDYRVNNLANFFRQARDLSLSWTGIFLVLLGAAALLKVAEEFSAEQP